MSLLNKLYKFFLNKKNINIKKKNKIFQLSPSQSQKEAFDKSPLKYNRINFENLNDFNKWKIKSTFKLKELLNLDNNKFFFKIIEKQIFNLPNNLIRYTFYINFSSCRTVPVHIIVNNDKINNKPILIYQSGSNTGVHVSWGESRSELDAKKLKLYSFDIASKAALRGWCVICIEQFGFGERKEKIRISKNYIENTGNEFSAGILLGKSLVGERVQDVSNVINWIETSYKEHQCLSNTNINKIIILGHSSGGTTGLYSAAIDQRIKGCILSGCIGNIKDTITLRPNISGDAVIPSILEWFEINDIVNLISPKYFYALAGKVDHIWPYSGLEKIYKLCKNQWQLNNSLNKIKIIECSSGHRPYIKETLELIDDIFVKN